MRRFVPTLSASADLALLGGLLVVALLGFRTSYGGYGWLAAGGYGLMLGLVLAHLSAAARVPVGVLALLTVVAAWLLGGPVVPDTTVAGFVPTVQTASALAQGGLQGWAGLLSIVPPVGSSYHLLGVPYLAALVAAVTSATFLLRTRWLWPAVAGPALLLGLGILFGTREPAALRSQGAGFVLLLLVWTGVRAARHRRATVGARVRPATVVAGALVLAAAAGAGVAGGPLLPGAQARERYVLRDRTTPPFDPKEYASPLGAFRRYAVENKNKDMLTVAGLPAGSRVRLATLDSYDGLVWSVAGGLGPEGGASGWFQKVGDTVPRGVGDAAATDAGRTTKVQMTVTVQALEGVWVPDVGQLTRIRFTGPRSAELADAFRYNFATGTAAVPVRLGRGDGYTLEADVATDPEPSALAGRGLQPVVLPAPQPVPELVAQFAGDATGDAPDALGRVQALVKTFRQGYYSDGQDGQAQSSPGHGAGRMVDLFDAPQLLGNDEQYASAMALALRKLEIPARIVVGFRVDKRRPTQIRGSDLHAWVEVPVDGVGWVPFDPTPDTSRQLTDQTPQPKPKPRLQNQPLPPPPVVAPEQKVQAAQQQQRKARTPDDGHPWLRRLATVALLGGPPVLLVVGAAGAVLFAKTRRRRRRRSAGSAVARFVGGWDDVVDLATDLRRPLGTAVTRSEGADGLGVDGALLLAVRADEAVFSAGHTDEVEAAAFWDLVSRVEAEMLGGVRRRDRWRARLSLASLRRPAHRAHGPAETSAASAGTAVRRITRRRTR